MQFEWECLAGPDDLPGEPLVLYEEANMTVSTLATINGENFGRWRRLSATTENEAHARAHGRIAKRSISNR